MSVSRYGNLKIIDKKYYESLDFPTQEELDAISTLSIRINTEERLDTIAKKYLGNSEYWWVICVMNNISWPFDFVAGKIIKIPADVNDVLKLF